MAHRGGEGLWPSNTLYAFERAISLSADALELDIQSTADGVLVVRHDPFVESTTNGSGEIRSFSLAELKKLDAGYTWTNDGGKTFPFRGQGITIPTLEEVFSAFPGILLNIDIKPEEPSVVHRFCEMLNAYLRQGQVIVGSFSGRQMDLFRRQCPEVRPAAGMRETQRFLIMHRLFLDRFYHSPAYAFQIPEYAGRLHVATPRFIRRAHARGFQVHVWTVNDPADMLRLIKWGVDGLMTDYPDRLGEIRGHRAA